MKIEQKNIQMWLPIPTRTKTKIDTSIYMDTAVEKGSSTSPWTQLKHHFTAGDPLKE